MKQKYKCLTNVVFAGETYSVGKMYGDAFTIEQEGDKLIVRAYQNNEVIMTKEKKQKLVPFKKEVAI